MLSLMICNDEHHLFQVFFNSIFFQTKIRENKIPRLPVNWKTTTRSNITISVESKLEREKFGVRNNFSIEQKFQEKICFAKPVSSETRFTLVSGCLLNNNKSSIKMGARQIVERQRLINKHGSFKKQSTQNCQKLKVVDKILAKNENSRTDILLFHRLEKVEFLQILEKN